MGADRRKLSPKDVALPQMKVKGVDVRASERPRSRNTMPAALRRGRSGGSQDSPPDTVLEQVDHKARLVSGDSAEPGPGSLVVGFEAASAGPSERRRPCDAHLQPDGMIKVPALTAEPQEKLTRKKMKKLKGGNNKKGGEAEKVQATNRDSENTRRASQEGESSLGQQAGRHTETAAGQCQGILSATEGDTLSRSWKENGKSYLPDEDIEYDEPSSRGVLTQPDFLESAKDEDLLLLQSEKMQAAGLHRTLRPGKELIRKEGRVGTVLSQLGPCKVTPSSQAIKKDSTATRRPKVKRPLPKEARAVAKKHPRFSKGACSGDDADGFSSDEDLKLSLVKGKASSQGTELHSKLSAEEDDLFAELERTDDEMELQSEGEDERLAREEAARVQEEERLREEERLTELERQREIERLKNLEWQKEEAKRRDEEKRRGEERWREERKRKDRERRKEQERLKEEARLKEEKKRLQEERRLAEEREKAALEEAREEALREEERAKISLQLSALQRIQATIEAAKEAKLALSEEGETKQGLSSGKVEVRDEEVSAESVRDARKKRPKPSSLVPQERKLKTVRLSMLDIAAAAEEMSPRHCSPSVAKADSPDFKRSQLSTRGGVADNDRLGTSPRGKQLRSLKSPRVRETSSQADPLPPLISPMEVDPSCSFKLSGETTGRPYARKEPRFPAGRGESGLDLLDESDESEDDDGVSTDLGGPQDSASVLEIPQNDGRVAGEGSQRSCLGGEAVPARAWPVKSLPERMLQPSGTHSDAEADWIVNEDSTQRSRDLEVDQTKLQGHPPLNGLGLLLRPGQGMLANTGVKAVC